MQRKRGGMWLRRLVWEGEGGSENRKTAKSKPENREFGFRGRAGFGADGTDSRAGAFLQQQKWQADARPRCCSKRLAGRIIRVDFPFQGILCDVLADFAESILAADDALEKARLPGEFLEAIQSGPMRDRRFEGADHHAQRSGFWGRILSSRGARA